ncbi:MAG: hypothetical protein WC889_12740 [Myxococcota bacterium]
MTALTGLFLFISALLAFLLFVIYLPKSSFRGKRIDTLTAEAEDLKKKLEETRSELKVAKEELVQVRPEINDLRGRYKSARKEAFEAEEKVNAAREAAAEAERSEQKHLITTQRLREEMAAVRVESEKATRSIDSRKTEVETLQAKVREVEAKNRELEAKLRAGETDPKAGEKTKLQAAAMQERISKLEKKIASDRADGLDRARQAERFKRQYNAVNDAYTVLRGQYNALHDRLLGMMGIEGKAEDDEPHHAHAAPASAPVEAPAAVTEPPSAAASADKPGEPPAPAQSV